MHLLPLALILVFGTWTVEGDVLKEHQVTTTSALGGTSGMTADQCALLKDEFFQITTLVNELFLNSGSISSFYRPKIPVPDAAAKASIPTSISALLSQKHTSGGIKQVMLNGLLTNVQLEFFDGLPWVLILCYYHKGGTNPPIRFIGAQGDFPLRGPERPLGTDGPQDIVKIDDQRSALGAGWGHVTPAGLANVQFTEMLWYARNPTKVINFRTADPSMVNYSKTGKGNIAVPFTYTLRAGHNASIPGDAPDRWFDKGDLALVDFPFWKYGMGHWAVKGTSHTSCVPQGCWQVDDWTMSSAADTIHEIWIR